MRALPSLSAIAVIGLLAAGCHLPAWRGAESALAPATAIPVESPVPQRAHDVAELPAFTLAPTLSEPELVLPDVSLSVELFYDERWMRIRQEVSIPNISGQPWDEIVFNVPLNATADAFYLDALTVTSSGASQDGLPPFLPAQTVLRVPLPTPLPPGESAVLSLRYRVVIPPVSAATWPPLGTTGWTADLIQAGEWYPALVPYSEEAGWVTWDYHPVGDPTFYPLSNIQLEVITDREDVVVASGGLLANEANVWRFSVERARGVAFFASPFYKVQQGEAAGIPIASYYLADHQQAGQDALAVAGRSIELFNRLYGPYPYDSLTIAENGFFGGMEYSALISVTDYAYITYDGAANSILHALVAHETAHQWWYGAVGNHQASEPWLDESLAFYSEQLYFENYYPGYVSWWWEARVIRFDHYGPVDASIYSYAESSDFILSMYGQAALFVDDLRHLMGEDAFFVFLQDYYQTYKWEEATAEDFFTVARRHSDQDLSPLIEAYFANRDL